MKASSVIVAIVVFVLWLVSLAYIAPSPPNVQSMLPEPPMGNVPKAFLGVLVFLLSMVIIAFWAGFSRDSPKPPPTLKQQQVDARPAAKV